MEPGLLGLEEDEFGHGFEPECSYEIVGSLQHPGSLAFVGFDYNADMFGHTNNDVAVDGSVL